MNKILILSGANGIHNLGDDAMYQVIAKESIKKGYKVITDGKKNWKSNYAIQVLPFIHKAIDMKGLKTLSSTFNIIRYFITEKYSIPFIRYILNLFDPWVRTYSRIMPSVDLVIFAGTGSMNDKFANHGIIGRGMIINIAYFFKKKILVTENGIGPINKKINKLIASRYINKISKIYVREKIVSKNILINLGYPKSRVKEVIDDAFYLKPAKEDYGSAKKIIKNLQIQKPFIVINLHQWDKGLTHNTFNALYKTFHNVYRYDLLLVSNYYLPGRDDRILLRDLKFFLNDKGMKNIYLLDKQITPAQMKALLSLSYFVIASRYHIGVFSLAENVPAILIRLDNEYYDHKMKGILNWYGLNDYVVDLSKQSLAKTVRNIFSHRNQIIRSLRQFNTAYTKEGYKFAKLFN